MLSLYGSFRLLSAAYTHLTASSKALREAAADMAGESSRRFSASTAAAAKSLYRGFSVRKWKLLIFPAGCL